MISRSTAAACLLRSVLIHEEKEEKEVMNRRRSAVSRLGSRRKLAWQIKIAMRMDKDYYALA